MRKTGYYTAFIGLFMAAALTVTACGASAKAPDVSSVVGGSIVFAVLDRSKNKTCLNAFAYYGVLC